jgi:phage tail-like protein
MGTGVDGDGAVSPPGDPQHYRYLNRAGRWEGFDRVGLDLHEGALALQSLPLLEGTLPAGLAQLGAPEGVAGVVALPGGLVLFTDPTTHRVLMVDPCDASRRPIPCVSGPGDGLEAVRAPRGLAWHRGRDVVLVADSGNDRVVLLDRAQLRIVEVWDGLHDPRSVACDADGDVYVVAAGDDALVKLDELGRLDEGFAARLGTGPPLHPAEVALTGARVVVLDTGGHVHVLGTGGEREDDWDTDLDAPMGLAAIGDVVLLGDNATRRLVAFAMAGGRRGEAYGYAGPVAAVAGDGHGGVLVHPGGGDGPLRLALAGAYGTRGVLWGGPFASPDDTSAPRHLLRAAVTPGAAAHVQLYVVEQAAGQPAPPVDPMATAPFADPRWHELPIAPDAVETLFAGAPLDEVWIGMTFSGEGLASPVLHQIRIDYAHTTYLELLPALYSRDTTEVDLLARWLTVFESASDHVQGGLDGLVALFVASAAPPAWLPWLAGWLALELPDGWDTERRRAAIAGAFAATGRRGTVAGLREALRERAGVEAVVEEPLLQMSWWELPADDSSDAEVALGVLGSGTVLARAEPQGAVLSTSAVLDGSFLTPQEDYAVPLFEDVAHQFTVRVYRGASHSEDAVATARAVLDAERPADTIYHLCVVEPRLRVGVQARLEIDAIVAGDTEPTLLDDTGAAGLVLDGPPVARLGAGTRIGQTHLTDG